MRTHQYLLSLAALFGFMGVCRAPADFIERYDADGDMNSIWTDGIYNGIAFIGSSVANGDGDSNGDGDIDTPSGNAWGLRPAPNNLVVPGLVLLAHTFDQGPLLVGQTLRIDMDSGYVEDFEYAAAVGFSLYGGGDVRFQFWYEPMESSNYKFGSTYGAGPGFAVGEDSGVPFTDEGIRVSFALTAVDEYSVTITSLSGGSSVVYDERSLSLNAGIPIDQIQIFSLGNNGGTERDVFFNNFEIIPEPGTLALLALGGLALCAARVRRRRGASTQQHAAVPWTGP